MTNIRYSAELLMATVESNFVSVKVYLGSLLKKYINIKQELKKLN